MGAKNDIHRFLIEYSEAFNHQDRDAVSHLFALDDPRFSMFEDTSAARLGPKELKGIADRLPTLVEPKLYFEEIRVDLLGDAAVVTGFQRVRAMNVGSITESKTRTTMVLVRTGRDWRVLHAHFSSIRP